MDIDCYLARNDAVTYWILLILSSLDHRGYIKGAKLQAIAKDLRENDKKSKRK